MSGHDNLPGHGLALAKEPLCFPSALRRVAAANAAPGCGTLAVAEEVSLSATYRRSWRAPG